MFDPLPWLILLPLTWATLAFVQGPGHGSRLAVAGLALQVALAATLAQQIVTGGARVLAVGGWGAPLGIDLAVDGLSMVMLLLTQGVALPLAFYARAYFAEHAGSQRYFWPLTGYLLAAMNALFLSADVFNIYVTLELLSLAAVGLVALPGGAGPISAAMRYLLATLLGSGAYLLGVALLYGVYGSVSLPALASLIVVDAPLVVSLAAALMLLGLMLKTALFPFHFWLPPAHGGAPAPVSALLSALVIKASFYLILRLWFDVFAPIASVTAAQLVGGLGAGAVLWGSLLALRQTQLKMLVAYSTVAQVGYLFLLLPLATGTTTEVTASAWQGGVLQVVAHGLAKAAMFAAAGAMITATGRNEIAGIAGVATRLPLTLFSFALAGVTIMGLPPSGGFAAKWLLLSAALASGQWWWIVVMVAGGLLSAAYVFKVLRQAFLPAEAASRFKVLPRMLEWPSFLLAMASLLLGLAAGELLHLLDAA